MAVKTYASNYNYGSGAARFYHGEKVAQIGKPGSPGFHPALAPRPNSHGATITPRSEFTATQEKIMQKIEADIAARRAGKAKAAAKPQTPADIAKEKMLAAAKAAPKHAVLRWDGGNSATCFESGTYSKKTGILNLVFQKRDDGSGFDFACDLETALDIFMDESPGTVFNAELR